MKNCNKCKHRDLCKSFSEIKISYFMPMDSRFYPKTAMKCKMNENHPTVDTLINKILINNKDNSLFIEPKASLYCNEKACDSRLESAKGLFNINGDIELENLLITRTSIENKLLTAKESALFSMNTISPKYTNNDANLYFTGLIDTQNKLKIKSLKRIRVDT